MAIFFLMSKGYRKMNEQPHTAVVTEPGGHWRGGTLPPVPGWPDPRHPQGCLGVSRDPRVPCTTRRRGGGTGHTSLSLRGPPPAPPPASGGALPAPSGPPWGGEKEKKKGRVSCSVKLGSGGAGLGRCGAEWCGAGAAPRLCLCLSRRRRCAAICPHCRAGRSREGRAAAAPPPRARPPLAADAERSRGAWRGGPARRLPARAGQAGQRQSSGRAGMSPSGAAR